MVPWRRCLSKSGDSCMAERAIQMLPARAAPTKKGMRHPQASSRGVSSRATVAAETATASSAPTSLAADASDVTRPRRPGGAPSSR